MDITTQNINKITSAVTDFATGVTIGATGATAVALANPSNLVAASMDMGAALTLGGASGYFFSTQQSPWANRSRYGTSICHRG